MTGITEQDRAWADAIAALPRNAAGGGALGLVAQVLADPALIAEVQWRIDHYGPRDATPFQFSRFESQAHAALSPIVERLAAVLDALGTGAGQAVVDALDEVEDALAGAATWEIVSGQGMWALSLHLARKTVTKVRAAVTTADDAGRDRGEDGAP